MNRLFKEASDNSTVNPAVLKTAIAASENQVNYFQGSFANNKTKRSLVGQNGKQITGTVLDEISQ